ncbi:MAG: hypothetical protein P8I91_02045 [Phycisphaerales bacterium]|nr:hypothetical protein [Phycisphaerales bacterium]
MQIHKIPMLLIVAPLVMTAEATAQEYPFFVQPMTVQDIRLVGDELELSREQELALLGNYEEYNLDFESLQDKDVKVVMDHLLDLSTRVQWWGGEFEIPPKDEIMGLVRETLSAIRAFGKIDDAFFNDLAPLLSEIQLVRLEQERDRRALGRLSMLHRNIIGELNDGASPDLLTIMRRIEVDGEIENAVDEILVAHAKRTLSILARFESAGKDMIENLLDEVDNLGLRDMEMAGMMAFAMDENNQQRMIAIFDELSKPLQDKAALMSRENRRSFNSLIEVLPVEQARDLRGRFVRSGYREVNNGILSARSTLRKLADFHQGTPLEAEATRAIEQIDQSWTSLSDRYMLVLDAQRKYRTMAQLRQEEPLEAQDRVESAELQREQILEKAKVVIARLKEEGASYSEEDKKMAGSGGKDTSVSDVVTKLGVNPLTAEQVELFGKWLGADEASLQLMAVMQSDYAVKATALLDQQGRAFLAQQDVKDEESDWRQRQARWSARRGDAAAEVNELEQTLFDDLVLALPEAIDRERIDRIRDAFKRSRRRARVAASDWMFRNSSEAIIDLTAVILETDPQSLDSPERSAVLDQLIVYDAAIGPLIDKLEVRLEKVRSLESRLWNSEQDYEPEVRQAMRKRWQSRRSEVTEVADELALFNREAADGVFAAVPDQASWSLRDAYERAAYPDIFRDEQAVDPALSQLQEIGLSPEQQQKVERRATAYRASWLQLTREMIQLKRDSPGGGGMFPINRDRMESGLTMARLKYRRGQLDERTMAQLELILEPSQIAAVAAFADAEESDK